MEDITERLAKVRDWSFSQYEACRPGCQWYFEMMRVASAAIDCIQALRERDERHMKRIHELELEREEWNVG